MWEDEGTFDSVSARLLATAANILGRAGDPTEEEVATEITDRLRRGKCNSDKQALQMFLGRFQLDDAGVVVYKGMKLHILLQRCERICLECAWSVALVMSTNMARGTCKCARVGSVVHRRKYGRNHSCSVCWCFLQLGKTYATTKLKLSIPKYCVDS